MLFEILSYKDPSLMKEPSIRFLINHYIKVLDLSNCGIFNHTPILDVLKHVGHTIVSLNISGRSWGTKKIVHLVSLLPKLETINLDFIRSKNSLLSNIHQKCPHVKTISLSNTRWVTDRSLHFLCTLSEMDELERNPTIESLDVMGTEVTEDGMVFALRYFPSLKFLRSRHVAKALHLLHRDDLFSSNLENLPKYGLREICIYSDVLILEVLQICIVLCPNLTSLSINKVISPLEMELCLNLRCLKDVQLIFEPEFNLNCPSDFFDLHKCNLEMLHLAGAKFSVAALSQCRNLRSLNLTHMVFEKIDESVKPCSNIFPYLTHLEINKMDLTDNNVLSCVILIVSSCSILKKLTLQSVFKFPDNAMDSILRCNFVTDILELDLSFSKINVSSINKVLSLVPQLTRLVIEGCNISEFDYCGIFARYGRTIEIIWS